jgi:hypothetical protein
MSRKKKISVAHQELSISTAALPFETRELRRLLEQFLNELVPNPLNGQLIKVGNFKWGVYSFYDYDDEPIYVGQTKESLRTRIRRHLTNQRTDAVAMNVLDPFEVYKIAVYPIPELQNVNSNSSQFKEAQKTLNTLERMVYDKAIEKSTFKAILNEKEPPPLQSEMVLPNCVEGIIISDEVKRVREHPDIRIARRTQTIARLAQTISERKVTKNLRKVLLTQATRLEELAQKRYDHAADVPASQADDTVKPG